MPVFVHIAFVFAMCGLPLLASAQTVTEVANGVWHIEVAGLPEACLGKDDMAVEGDLAALSARCLTVQDSIGAGGVYVFRRQDGRYHFEQHLVPDEPVRYGGFGYSLDLDVDDGGTERILVGEPRASRDQSLPFVTGRVHLFERGEDGLWKRVELWQNPNLAQWGDRRDDFGHDVSLDGEHAAVSAWDYLGGEIYTYQSGHEGGWQYKGDLSVPRETIVAPFGYKIELRGDWLVQHARSREFTESTEAYAYQWRDTAWVRYEPRLDSYQNGVMKYGVGSMSFSGEALALLGPDLRFGFPWPIRLTVLRPELDAWKVDGEVSLPNRTLPKWVSLDGDRLLVSLQDSADAGHLASLYSRGESGWHLAGRVQAPNGEGFVYGGGSAVLAGDHLFVRGVNVRADDPLYVYDLSVVVANEYGVDPAPASLSVWPNPARDHVTLALPEATDLEVNVVIYDVLGREVAAHAQTLAGGRLHQSVEALAAGTYFVHVTYGANTLTQPLVVLR